MLEVPSDEIHIWLVDDRQVEDTAQLAMYRELLNEKESARHQRFVFSRHRHQFLIARALMRSALSQYLEDTAPAAVDIVTNKLGKPVLAGEGGEGRENGKTGLRFNLSHTNGMIALAVLQDHPVGIDVEFLSRRADVMGLARRYFSRQESTALESLPVGERNDRFFDLWTLKEAYLKSCGYGLRTPLDQFSFAIDDNGIGISFSDKLEDDPNCWQFWQLAIDGGYRLSLALNSEHGNKAHGKKGEGSDYRLKVRRGIPLGEFTEIEPVVLRETLR